MLSYLSGFWSVAVLQFCSFIFLLVAGFFFSSVVLLPDLNMLSFYDSRKFRGDLKCGWFDNISSDFDIIIIMSLLSSDKTHKPSYT